MRVHAAGAARDGVQRCVGPGVHDPVAAAQRAAVRRVEHRDRAQALGCAPWRRSSSPSLRPSPVGIEARMTIQPCVRLAVAAGRADHDRLRQRARWSPEAVRASGLATARERAGEGVDGPGAVAPTSRGVGSLLTADGLRERIARPACRRSAFSRFSLLVGRRDRRRRCDGRRRGRARCRERASAAAAPRRRAPRSGRLRGRRR